MKRMAKKCVAMLLIFTMIFSLGKWRVFASEITDAKVNTLYKLDNTYYLCHKAEDTEKNIPAAFFEISSTETLIKIDL